jgi:hypothetical protein
VTKLGTLTAVSTAATAALGSRAPFQKKKQNMDYVRQTPLINMRAYELLAVDISR